MKENEVKMKMKIKKIEKLQDQLIVKTKMGWWDEAWRWRYHGIGVKMKIMTINEYEDEAEDQHDQCQ